MQNSTFFIGIDPGRGGAMAILTDAGHLAFLDNLPLNAEGWLDLPKARSRIHQALPAGHRLLGAVERPLGFTPNITAMMKLALSFGQAQALLQLVCEQVFTPTAKEWKTLAGLTREKADSVSLARKRISGLPTKALRHDKAEALLLADFAHHKAAGTEVPSAWVTL
jgi:hypothetical protein